MKEQFGVKAFDLVFLDHWKDRYLPDTKLMEASLSCSFSHFLLIKLLVFLPWHDSLPVSGVLPSQERQCPAGRQRHLPRNSRLLGICPQQPAIRKPVLQVSPGVYQSGGWLGEVCLLRVVYSKFVLSCFTWVLVNLRPLLPRIHWADLKSVKSVFLICHRVC